IRLGVDINDLKAAGFPGTQTNGSVDGGTGNLVADGSGSLFWSGVPGEFDGDFNPFWSGNDNVLFWTDTFLEMIYQFFIVPELDQVGGELKLDFTVAGNPISIVYRTTSPSRFWKDDSAPLWGGNDSTPFWAPVAELKPWPGVLDNITRQEYQFQISTGAGAKQGVVSRLKVKTDFADVEEELEDVSIAMAGTRLPITKSYKKIKVVNDSLQDDGGGGVSVKVADKDPALGPLLKVFDSSGAGTTGKVDAFIQGY
ncbi:MAG: hypothetical protein ACE5IM_11365, partial [Nitrospinota bacterium]